MRKVFLVLLHLVVPGLVSGQSPTTDINAALARLRPSDTLRFWASQPDYSGQRVTVLRVAGDTLVVRDRESRPAAIPAPRVARIDIGHLKRPNEGHVFGSGGKGMLKGFIIGAGIGALVGAVYPDSPNDRGDQSDIRVLVGAGGGAVVGSIAGFITGTVRGSNPYVSWEELYRRP